MNKYLNLTYYLKKYKKIEIDSNYLLSKTCLDNVDINKKIIFDGFSKDNNIQNYKKNLYLYDKVLDDLYLKLNKIHNVDFSKKFWETVLGWWLIDYIKINIETWMKIQLVKNFNITHYYFVDFPLYEKILYDCEDSINKFKSNKWAQFHYQRWISIVYPNITKEKLDYKYNKNFKIDNKNNFKNLIKRLFNIFYYIKNIFSTNSKKKIFFINHYFTKERFSKININNTYTEISNYFHLKISKKKYKSYDKKLRNQILLTFTHTETFEKIFNKMLMDDLPMIFLEHFDNFLSLSLKMYNFKESKIIFTSQSHFFDSMFKFSIAYNREKFNKKLYLMQHGGSYFYTDLDTHLFWEQRIADIFFCWGKAENNKKIKYLGINRIKKVKNKPEYLLIILDDINRNYSSYVAPNPENLFDYLEEISDLIFSLQKKYKIKIRLPRNDIFYKKYLIKKNSNITFDYNKSSFDSYKKSALVISCAFATSALETIYNNIPTIIFIPKKMNNYYYEKIYKLFHKSIFFEKNNELSKFLLDDNFEIKSWWFSSSIQSTINEFNKNYCIDNISLYEEFKKYI